MSTPNNRIPWKRLTAEGLAIMASILLALAVDASWESRSDRREERQELARFRAELWANIEDFKAQIGGQQAMVDYQDSLLVVLRAAPSDRREPIDNGLLLSLLFSPLWQPETAVLDALISSGRLSLITDPAIREGVARVSSRFSDLELSQGLRARSFYMDRVLPYLTAEGDITGLLGERQVDVTELRRLGGPPWAVAEGETVLSNTTELRNLVAQQRLWSAEALRSLRETIEVLEEVLDLIDAD